MQAQRHTETMGAVMLRTVYHLNIRGDKNYMPSDFHVAFAAFRPPASSYPYESTGHKGTKPPLGSTWSRNTGGYHELACNHALEICRLAKSCEATTSQITNALWSRHPGKIEHYKHICAANGPYYRDTSVRRVQLFRHEIRAG